MKIRLRNPDRAASLFEGQDAPSLATCERCGQPTTARFCAFCRARAQILGERLASAPEAPEDEVVRREREEQIVRELADEVLPARITAGAS